MIRGFDTAPAGKLVRITAVLAAGLALAACAGTAPTARTVRTVPTVKHLAAASLHQEQGGFTLAEDVRVGADVRADFSSAVRLLTAKQYAQGITLLLNVTRKAPNLVAAHVDLGIAYEMEGDLDKAQASLERALALDPRHVVAYNELGMVLRRQGRFAAARASYEKALAIAPQFHYARLNLAILCDLYIGDLKCARDNYEAYRQEVPGDERTALWIRDLTTRTAQ